MEKNTVGFFGKHGGQFVSDELKKVLNELFSAYEEAKKDPQFAKDYQYYTQKYSGRPTPIYYCENLSNHLNGAKIYLKREDLNHLGAHKINNTIGQMLLAKRMGKKRVIAETGAGQHGVATAATAAMLGMECIIIMGEVDIKRQELNVFRMEMMGAKVVPAKSGQRTLKEAVDEALALWVQEADDTFYVLGSALGPHPYPQIVRDFQSIIGTEARAQMQKEYAKLPNHVIACVGGGSNAIGIFSGFIEDKEVHLIGVEPAGRGLTLGDHAASLSFGKESILHGFASYVLLDEQGEVAPVYSISAGLDYPSVGPEHSYLKDIGRAQYETASDVESLDAFFLLSEKEGIIPALESAHALAYAVKLAPTLSKDESILINLSGRGDKDIAQIKEMLENGEYIRKE